MSNVIEAAKKLLSVCDGAIAKDHQGFNGVDSPFVRDVLSRDSITAKQEKAIHKILKKYEGQLAGTFGINYNDLVCTVAEKNTDELEIVPGAEKFPINFGKYKGTTLAYVASKDPDYVRWLAEKSFITKVKDAAQKLINGEPLEIVPQMEGIAVSISGDRIIINSAYKYKDDIKDLSVRKWNPEEKIWECPLDMVTEISEKFPEAKLSEEFKKLLTKKQELKAMSDKATNGNTIKFDDLELMPFQTVGVEFAEKNEGKVLIADEMGLGKTVQALAYIRRNNFRPALIVCPASLKINWKREAEKWIPDDSTFVIDKSIDPKHDIYIINYDKLTKFFDELKTMNFQIMVLDESHYVKNEKAKRTKLITGYTDKELGHKVVGLAEIIPQRILLTGTPVLNRPKELFTQLHIIDPIQYNKFFPYGLRYCDGTKGRWGWDFSGASNLEELNNKLKSIMVRRKKTDVLKELPAKRRSNIEFDITNQTEYNRAEKHFLDWLEENSDDKGAINKAEKAEALVKMEKLKQLAVKGKMDDVIEWISDFLDTDEKLVVFATHHMVINQIIGEFADRAVMLTGASSIEDRQKAIDEFQNNPEIRLFVGNIKAAGVGITLTEASNVAFVEFPWTPAELMQAEDRVHRIGQDNAVNVYNLITDTIEVRMAELLHEKCKVIDAMIDGVNEVELSIFEDIVKKIKVGDK